MGITRRLPLQFISARLLSSSAALIQRSWTCRQDAPEKTDGESAVYKRALKLQRPSTVRYQQDLRNSVNLIGLIDAPMKAFNYGVYTFLKVRAHARPYRDFKILLTFCGEMAELSVQHLKPRDFVYVSGCLQSNVKADDEEGSSPCYKVDVKEINFVAENSLGLANQNFVKLEPEVSHEEMMQQRRRRLHLWHVFFANPAEWWDNRKCKLNPRAPDFKHKDTGEVLWLEPSDPPWINQQLQLYDSRFGKGSHGHQRNAWPHISPLVCDETFK